MVWVRAALLDQLDWKYQASGGRTHPFREPALSPVSVVRHGGMGGGKCWSSMSRESIEITQRIYCDRHLSWECEIC